MDNPSHKWDMLVGHLCSHCCCYNAFSALAAFLLPGNSFVVWLWSVTTKTIFRVLQLQVWLQAVTEHFLGRSTRWYRGNFFFSSSICYYIYKYFSYIKNLVRWFLIIWQFGNLWWESSIFTPLFFWKIVRFYIVLKRWEYWHCGKHLWKFLKTSNSHWLEF